MYMYNHGRLGFFVENMGITSYHLLEGAFIISVYAYDYDTWE